MTGEAFFLILWAAFANGVPWYFVFNKSARTRMAKNGFPLPKTARGLEGREAMILASALILGLVFSTITLAVIIYRLVKVFS